MRRRALLAALTAGVAGIAGCNGDPRGTPSTDRHPRTPTDSLTPRSVTTDDTAVGGTATTTDSPTSTSTQTATDTTTPREFRTFTANSTDRSVDVPDDGQDGEFVDLETIDRTYGLSWREASNSILTVRQKFRTTATAEHPAIVVQRVDNDGSRDLDVSRGAGPLDWSRLVSDLPRPRMDPLGAPYGPENTELVQAPTANHDLVDDPPVIYRPEGGLWQTNVATLPELPARDTLTPGESLYLEAAIVGRAGAPRTTRLPGWYAFDDSSEPQFPVWDTGRPGPTADSQFDDWTVSPLAGDGSTTWFHDATATTTRYLVPDTEVVSRPPATIRYRFFNFSRRQLHVPNFDRIRLLKLLDGQWFEVVSLPTVSTPEAPSAIDPATSRSYRWRFHDDAFETEDDDRSRWGAEYLGNGTYAIVFRYRERHDSAVADRAGALLSLTAPETDVVPEEDLSTTRDGSTVHVVDRPRELGAELVVTRTDDDPVRATIPEEVMNRLPGLRNTLPFFESGVREVRLRADRTSVDRTLGWLAPDQRGSERRATVRFEGQSYRVVGSGL